MLFASPILIIFKADGATAYRFHALYKKHGHEGATPDLVRYVALVVLDADSGFAGQARTWRREKILSHSTLFPLTYPDHYGTKHEQ